VIAARDCHMLPSLVCCLLASLERGTDVKVETTFCVLLKSFFLLRGLRVVLPSFDEPPLLLRPSDASIERLSIVLID